MRWETIAKRFGTRGKIVSAADHERIDGAAADWFARRQSDEWAPQLQERLEHWLDESPLHRVAYLRIEHAWERAERLKVLATGSRREIPPPGSWARSPFFGSRLAGAFRGVEPRRHRRRAVLAAGVAAAACLAGVWMLSLQGPVYRTPVGGLERVSLEDGSTLTLNTDSAVRLEFSAHERGVKLERGEAFFEVAKDPGRPFVVETDGHRVVAVGTQFAVRREDDDGDIRVVVTEGTVRVEGDRGAKPVPPTAAATPDGSVLLPAGTIAHADGADVLLEKAEALAAQEALSWRRGVLVFHDLTLAQAAAEFNRYNRRQIVIGDPAVAELTIAGRFRANNVEAFARLLEKGYPIRIRSNGDDLVLESR
jgi:transmembrane sensor